MESIDSLPLIQSNEVSITSYDPGQTTFKGQRIKLKTNPIFRNNYFLMCYNTSYNKVNGIPLTKLPRNRLYYFLFPVLSIKYFFLQVALAFIPYLNILWACLLIFMWVVYERAFLVYRNNRKKVANPFAKMIYEPNLCKLYKCMNKFLEIPTRFLDFQESQQAITSTRATIMIYNQNFKKMHTQFPNYRYLHIGHLVFCIFVILISYFWLYRILGISEIII